MNTQVQTVTQDTNDAISHSTQSDSLLAVVSRAASDPNVDMDKMERLLAMQERVMAQQAKQSFSLAMASLQSRMPEISKDGEIKVNGVVRSKYAKYEDIMSAIKPLLMDHGVSVTFRSDFVEGQLEVTGVVSHKDGHSEQTTMRLPFDSSGSKNNVQAIGSSVSYGKRYVLCMLLNISTGGEDDDGNAADANNSPENQIARIIAHNDILRESLASVLCIKEGLLNGDFGTAKEAWNELTEDEQRALWLATTKGGIFTTEERKLMKSSEWIGA